MAIFNMAQRILFPTSVGMIRECPFRRMHDDTIPHIRGDDPADDLDPIYDPALFPTSVGMIRVLDTTGATVYPIPHIRGDDPALIILSRAIRSYSPHPWG